MKNNIIKIKLGRRGREKERGRKTDKEKVREVNGE
jgi:hypothetical protein